MSDHLSMFAGPRLMYANAQEDELRLPWSRQTALLVYLASEPDWHSRASIAELFRPEANAKDAAAYVRRLLHRLGAEFPALTGITEEAGMLRWTGSSDVTSFQAALQAGDVEEALRIQSASFLAEVPATGMALFDQWIVERRNQLRSQLDQALVHAISHNSRATSDQRARWMRNLGEHAALNEGVIQFLLAQAVTAVEYATATLAFENFQHRLITQHGRRPMEVTLERYRAAKAVAGSQPLTMAPRSTPEPTDAPRATATQDLLSNGMLIWGRDSELARLHTMLQDPEQRLISIVGMGGMGKTWLARALFHRTKTQPQGQVEWVDLIASRTRSEMLTSIASAVGMVPRQGSLENQLLYWLKTRNIVLFVDNFEQLLDHRDLLDTLLAGAAGLRFVVTSRRPLLLPSEQLFHLQGLAWTGAAAPAFQLFKHHADRAGSPVLHNSDDIEAVLNHLEGMPLAIEMAAAWMPLLSPAEILRQLRQDPALIDSASDNQSEGRGISAVLRTTWAQMSTEERQAMVAIASVRGPMDWEAATALVRPDPKALLRLAAALIVRRDAGGRYTLHPLFREFVEKNASHAMLAEADMLHARHFIERIAALPLLAPGVHDAERLRRHGQHIPDFIKAWQYCVEHSAIDALARAFPNLSELLMLARHFEEAMELCKYTTQALGVKAPISAQVASLHATSAFRAGRMAEAAEVAQAGLLRHANPSTTARLYTCLASVHWFHGRYDQAMSSADLAHESLTNPDFVTAIQVREQLALCHYANGDLGQAAQYLRTNQAMASLQGAKQLEARALCLLGVMTTADDRGADALPLFHRALDIFEQNNDLYEIGYCLRGMSFAYYRVQQFDLQMRCARRSLEVFERAGYYHETGEALFAITTALHASGDPHGAKETCKKALAHCYAVGNIPAAVRCVAALGIFIMLPPGQKMDDVSAYITADTLAAQRITGLSIVLFGVGYAAFRKSDRLIYDRHLQQLRVTDKELALAEKIASQRSFESTCAELLQERPHLAPSASAPQSGVAERQRTLETRQQ